MTLVNGLHKLTKFLLTWFIDLIQVFTCVTATEMFPTEADIFMLARQHYDYCFAEIWFHGPNFLKGQENAVSDEVEKI